MNVKQNRSDGQWVPYTTLHNGNHPHRCSEVGGGNDESEKRRRIQMKKKGGRRGSGGDEGGLESHK